MYLIKCSLFGVCVCVCIWLHLGCQYHTECVSFWHHSLCFNASMWLWHMYLFTVRRQTWPLSCEWHQLLHTLLSLDLVFLSFFFNIYWRMLLLENWTHSAANWNLPTFPFQWRTDLISCSREEHDDHSFLWNQISMAAVMVLGERSNLVISGSRSLPCARFRPAPRDQERDTTKKRYDWDEACGRGWILPESACHLFREAKLMDRQFGQFFGIDIHAPQLGTKWEGDLNTLSRCFPPFPKRPVARAGYLAVGRAWVLTYGKMEAGAEASPQQHPRRKPVLHGLEDQKRVS